MELFIVLFFLILFFFLFKKESKRSDQVNVEMMKSFYNNNNSQHILNDFYRDTQETMTQVKKELDELKELSKNLENALEEINLMLMGVPPQKRPPKNPELKIIKLKKKEEKKDDEPTKQ